MYLNSNMEHKSEKRLYSKQITNFFSSMVVSKNVKLQET